MDDLPSPEALQAYLLRGVIAATMPAGETAADARLRAAIIVQAFQTLAPDNALEAMMACHVIALQFVCDGALRDLPAGVPSAGAGDTEGNGIAQVKAQERRRAQVNTLSRTLGQWLARYESTQARRGKREAEERKAAGARTAAQAPSVPAKAPAPAPARNGAENGTEAPVRTPERTPPPPAAIQRGVEPSPPRASSPPVAASRINGHAASSAAMPSAAAMAAAVRLAPPGGG